DVVHARAGAGDHPQVGRARQELGRHARLAPHDQRMRLSELTLEHFSRLTGDRRDLDLRCIAELFEASLRDAVRDDHAKGHERVPPIRSSNSSSAATVWSPMWPMRIVESLRAP